MADRTSPTLKAPGRRSIVTVSDVTKTFATRDGGQLPVLEGINLDVQPGEIVALLGKSGSGKSTLLRCIAGLITPSSGTVYYRGKPLQGINPGVSLVFQTFALLPWLTVKQNVELGLEAQGVEVEERSERAEQAIDLIGLDGFESAFPKELSGGMRQRVGFARALVVQPDLLLMDEPFSALDVLTAETLRTDLIDLWTEGKLPIKAILMVTHNIEEAVLMADRILVFQSNPGRVAHELRVPFTHPRNRLDPAFRKLVDEIYAVMTRRQPGTERVTAPTPAAAFATPLAQVGTNLMSGLLETLAGPPYEGKADLPALAESLQLEVDELLPLGEMLQLLRFAELEEGDIKLTPVGREFAHSDLEHRKKLFATTLLANVPLIASIRRVLDERPNHRASAVRFRDELEDTMSPEYAEATLRTAIAWGRYGELFVYDEEADQFELEEPEEAEAAD